MVTDAEKTLQTPNSAGATVARWLVVYAVLLIVLGYCGWLRAGLMGLSAATTAVIVCGGAAAAGRLVGRMFSGPGETHYQMLFGMLPRIGIPLAVCLVVYTSGREQLVDAGLIFYLLPAYIVSLAFDTRQALAQLDLACSPRSKAGV